MSNYKENLKHITTLIFDYDGVLTSGTVLINPEGELLRTANVKDGYALKHAIVMGLRVAIISGGRSQSVKKRMAPLGITDVFLEVEDKLKCYKEYVAAHNLKKEEVLYMGDDIPDYPVMKEVGIATCPADAAEEIKALADYISFQKGGKGCARDVIEQVMKVQGKWLNGDQSFLW
jgi:3-deoxy-D-manno-octulosonate 8-phosphate phosphatase (KDO 8-P phosphatase)